MIIEGRTITTLAELKDFADAAVAAAKTDAEQAYLIRPLRLRLHQLTPDERFALEATVL